MEVSVLHQKLLIPICFPTFVISFTNWTPAQTFIPDIKLIQYNFNNKEFYHITLFMFLHGLYHMTWKYQPNYLKMVIFVNS